MGHIMDWETDRELPLMTATLAIGDMSSKRNQIG